MSDTFNDHFASVAAHYAVYRPTYPPELFAWLADQCAQHELAWDCGAGNGQASLGLAEYFQQVIATDASTTQIAQAVAHPRIAYRAAPAEASGLDTQCADLIVVAQALHWFDLDRFYAEARRVLKPGGVIAAWSYGVFSLADATLDAIIQQFYREVVGPYWPLERHHVETGYRELAFPFPPIAAPAFTLNTRWDLPQLLGYLRSWSATGHFIQARGYDPVSALEQRLRTPDGNSDGRYGVTWPLHLLVGRHD